MNRLFLSLGLWFLLVVSFSFAAPAGEKVFIRLPQKATVVGPQMKLGEIAEITGTNKVLSEKLRRLELVKAPPAGRRLQLTRALVKLALRKEGYDLTGISFGGEEATEVLTESQEFSLEKLLPQLKAFVLKGLQESSENVEVKPSGIGQKVLLPAGEIRATFRPPLSGRYEGTLLLTAELEVDGRMVRVLPVRAQVEVFRRVVVTSRNVQKSEKLDGKNVETARKPASQIPPGALSELANVVGRTAATFLPMGAVLRVQSLYDPPAIKQGQTIRALVERGNVEIVVDVRAVDSGKAGESIRVENTQSRKILRAKVLDEKTVLIEDRKP